MSTNTLTKLLNNLIGYTGAVIGLLLFTGGFLWLLGVFFRDAFRALGGEVLIPRESLHFITIFSLILFGGFCMAWGGGMVNRKEWGAQAGGLVRAILTLYVGIFALLFAAQPGEWLGQAANLVAWIEPAATLSLYEQYVGLFWLVVGLWWLWLGMTVWFFFSQSRRNYYAQIYAYDLLPPQPAICEQCGLILQKGRCPVCDRPEQPAWLVIGRRRESLVFTEEEAEVVVGRRKDKNEAHITLSEQDTGQPELISGRHLSIRYHFDHRQFTLQDLASLNKTYLNGELLPPMAPRRLEHGDTINLGGAVELIFECRQA